MVDVYKRHGTVKNVIHMERKESQKSKNLWEVSKDFERDLTQKSDFLIQITCLEIGSTQL